MLKKICALMIAGVMVFALTACGGEETESKPASETAASEEKSATDEKPAEEKDDSEKTSADKFVESNGASIESEIEAEDGGLDCKVSAENNKVVVSVLTSQFDGMSDEDKAMFQQAYEAMKDEFKETVFSAVGDLDGVDAIIYRICDSEGNTAIELEYEVQ